MIEDPLTYDVGQKSLEEWLDPLVDIRVSSIQFCHIWVQKSEQCLHLPLLYDTLDLQSVTITLACS